MRLLLACALVAAALPMAADTTAIGTAKVTIQPAPASVAHVDGAALDFGVIISSANVQTKTVDFSTKSLPDRFTFTKDLNELLAVTVDSTCTLTNSEQKVPLTATLTSLAFGNDETATQGMIFVGGTLTIPAWARKATYGGTYNLTVAYK